ncbi:hypothetical protein PVAND_014683 [Polypedilum vanderplanki]|uniref:Uncharacterized protein n=1 Tax=Polypedilum vanderplanki TaxID=319348 RepID=A0A9J6BA31_POLVA|nr:hypothetical protein PVAND_014683 [Polypedilum vanderplanki]
MDKKFVAYVSIISAIYLILFRILYTTSGSDDFNKIFKKCDSSRPCLSFCNASKNKTLTNDFIKEHFENYENEEDLKLNLTNLKVFRMSLNCRFLEEKFIEEAGSCFEAVNIGKTSNFGSQNLKCLSFDHESINIESCKRDIWIPFSIQTFFLLSVLVLLILPLAAFIINIKTSNTAVERHLIALLSSLIIMKLVLFVWTLFGDLTDLEAFVGFAAPVLVLNFMIFDTFLTLKQFQTSKFNPHYLTRFGCLIALFMFLIFLLTFVDVEEIFGGFLGFQLSNVMTLFLVIVYIINFIIISISGIFYLKVKKSVRGLEHPRFQFERARFGLYVVLFGIISIDWIVSMIAVAVYQIYSYVFFIIAGITALYSSFLVSFISLLWFKNTQPLADTKIEIENGKVY